jgi:putative membrane protein
MMGFGFGGFGFLFMLLFIILIVGLAVWFVSLLFPRQTNPRSLGLGTYDSGDESPLDIIKKRYARGEITKDEYEEIRSGIIGDVT